MSIVPKKLRTIFTDFARYILSPEEVFPSLTIPDPDGVQGSSNTVFLKISAYKRGQWIIQSGHMGGEPLAPARRPLSGFLTNSRESPTFAREGIFCTGPSEVHTDKQMISLVKDIKGKLGDRLTPEIDRAIDEFIAAVEEHPHPPKFVKQKRRMRGFDPTQERN